ncbi:succinylglutamate desuccinylase/aspartoacylase family protein [Pseudomonas fluorescens]
MERIDYALPWSHLGSDRSISVFRFGRGVRKAYIQANLHADEFPGMRTAWELKKRLAELEERGLLKGIIELVPVANPLGLGQLILGNHQGRFDAGSGKNFNRDFVELSELVASQLDGHLGSDPNANVQLIRRTMSNVLANLPPASSQLQHVQRLLLSHACSSDVVLDLHCDAEAVVHMYALPQLWPKLTSLAAHIGSQVGLLVEVAGGNSFEESCSLPWLKLSRMFPQVPVPLACVAVTVELGGQADTGCIENKAHAEGILAFLAEQDLIGGDWPDAIHPPCEAMPLEGVELLFAPHPGVVSFIRKPGDWIEIGDEVLEVIDPLSDRVGTVCAGTSGLLFAIARQRYAQPGFLLAKVAGREELRGGNLLND